MTLGVTLDLGKAFGETKVTKTCGRFPKFAKPNLAFDQSLIPEIDNNLFVDRTNDPAVLLQADSQEVPFVGLIGGRIHRPQDGPIKDAGPLETGQAKRTAGRIKPVMSVLAIGVKNQAGRAAFFPPTLLRPRSHRGGRGALP